MKDTWKQVNDLQELSNSNNRHTLSNRRDDDEEEEKKIAKEIKPNSKLMEKKPRIVNNVYV